MNIKKQEKIALAIMKQKFVENANQPPSHQEQFFERMMSLALKANVPYKLALDFIELSPERGDVALPILQQTFLEFGMGPGHIQRVHALAEKAGVSCSDAHDFAEAVITAKLAETFASAVVTAETCS